MPSKAKRSFAPLSATEKHSGEKPALPYTATALRIWQHSHLAPLSELDEDLQDRILILRNHPDVCAMSHNPNIISYAAHQDYLRELQCRKPKFDSCALYCDAIRLLKESSVGGGSGAAATEQQDLLYAADSKVQDASSNLKVLRPIVGVVNVDMRIPECPLLGLYKNLYHYPHIKLGRILLFAGMLRASKLGLCEVFLECYSQNLAMQKLARQLGFILQSKSAGAKKQSSLAKMPADLECGDLLSYRRYIPSSKKLLQDPMFTDFAVMEREAGSLR